MNRLLQPTLLLKQYRACYRAVGEKRRPYVRLVPRQLYLPVGVNQFCRFTSLAWPRCWAALVR